jgi:serine/threonine protein kinase
MKSRQTIAYDRLVEIAPDAPATTPANLPEWARLEILQGMSADAIEELRQAMEVVEFAPGDAILHEGDDGDDMYILDKGTVRVQVRGTSKAATFERVLESPALFGEMALITHAPRTASVLAEEPARCLRMSSETFQAVAARTPGVAAFLTRIVGERLLEAKTIHHVGKYKVIGRLGAGAVATVFEAVHPGLERTVALKMLSHALVHHPSFANQFQDEAKIVAQLDHDHIVRVFDTEKAYGTHFIVMEKLSGCTLDDIIQGGTRLAWGAVQRILREIAGALDYSHKKGLLHRDIKPSNVFLTNDDRRVKLLDFGIAMSVTASAPGSSGLMGTPYYMSPEQIRGETLDGRSDLYSLGILAYELITRDLPFDADDLDALLDKHLTEPMPDMRTKAADVPDYLIQFVTKATAKNPENRFANCGEAEAFLRLSAELPIVQSMGLATVALSYHPTRRNLVMAALQELQEALGGLPGISVLCRELPHTGTEPSEPRGPSKPKA